MLLELASTLHSTALKAGLNEGMGFFYADFRNQGVFPEPQLEQQPQKHGSAKLVWLSGEGEPTQPNRDYDELLLHCHGAY